MKFSKNIWFYVGLTSASLAFLAVELVTHIEFFLHLAAIPLEVLLAVFIVERILERREAQEKRRQLLYIKSYLFRAEMRGLFLSNFEALKSPNLTMGLIRKATLAELRAMRRAAEAIEYESPEAMEAVIMAYGRARSVWLDFMNRAITFNFEEIFQDMIAILNFISDVAAFKENNPDRLFIHEAQRNADLMVKVNKVLCDGIKRFLDYAVELKEKQPHLFEDMMATYEVSSHVRQL